LPHCLEILKTAHQLTDKLVSVTLSSAHQLQFPETLTDLVSVARRIGSRVDDVVRALYPPLDPRLLEARSFTVHTVPVTVEWLLVITPMHSQYNKEVSGLTSSHTTFV